MITKIRSFQDSWLVKGILALTALSFMSLFGISGYIGRGGNNRPIVRVDDVVVMQDEINNQLNEQLQTTKNLFGDDMEISDAMRTAMLQEIVQKNLVNAIMQKTAEDNSVVISDELIRKIIYSQPEFMDASGQFSLDKMRRMLSLTGWSEQKYVETLRRDIIKQHLVQSPVEDIKLPHAIDPYLAELDSQRKIFQFAVIEPAKLKVDRKISEEEVQQYYQDFAPQFEEPESRDISFIELSVDRLASQIAPSDDEIKTYYEENISQFVIPEKRHVLQMVFDDQASADKAEAALNAGGDFFKVARDIAKQDQATTDLGEVSQDMLIADMSEAVFELKKGGYTLPVKSDMGWHIMKVVSITPKKETPAAAAKSKIIENIRKDRAYEQASEVISEIEDKLGAGATLEDIASAYNVKINQALGIKEDGSVKNVAAKFKPLVSGDDFIDTAFSYNTGEISQVMESDTGFAILRVDGIHDARQKDLADVRGEIEKMWGDSEKNAIAQEIVTDVTHDLENGDSFTDVAGRFNLEMHQTSPLRRGEAFAGLTPSQLIEIYQEKTGTPKIFNEDERVVIAIPSRVVRSKNKISPEKMDALRAQAQALLSQELANELIDAYGSEYKVRVKYKYLGINDL